MPMHEKDTGIGAPLQHFRDAVRSWSDRNHPRSRAAEMRWTVIPATDHLARLLLPPTLNIPWYRSLWTGVCEFFQPVAPPPDITSKPVLVRDIWGQYGRQKKSWVMSLGLQSAAIAGILALTVTPAVVKRAEPFIRLTVPADLAPPPIHASVKAHGGGGGGDHSPLPASFGRLPKFSPMPFVPPAAVVPNLQARLTMEPALPGPPDLKVPEVDVSQYGDPLAKIGPASNGPGSGGGIGSGCCKGVGPGEGESAGPGSGGIGLVYQGLSAGMTVPALVSKVEPEYSEEARKAKYQGTVQLYIEVDPSGRARNIRVAHSLGLGLDEKAMEAVAKWRFRPGTKNGKPVTMAAQVEVNFRLL